MLLNEIKDPNSYSGNKNSQFGTTWVRRDSAVKKIKKDELEIYLNDGWKPGRIEPKTDKEKLALRHKRYVKRSSFTRMCDNCGKQFLGKLYQKNCSKECSKWQSGKNAAATMKANGTNSGWHTRKGESSYPEKYFEELFRKENISGWVREKKVGRWFIDFAFEEKKIAVEIDGRQHDDLNRSNSDQLKDKYLTGNGWTVKRIKWFNPVTESNKEKLYVQIRKLLGELK